jgi:hypothetical protein
MPKALEESLKRRASKMIREGKLKSINKDAYVYGTLRKTGWKPSTQKT